MKIGLPKENFNQDTRVALIPANITRLMKKPVQVLVQSGAGDAAGFTDDDYAKAGATIVTDRAALLQEADIITLVNAKESQLEEIKSHGKPGQIIIGMMDPLTSAAELAKLADGGQTSIALELIPRITRAQSMDVLSSMATIAGYKAVILAAHYAPRLFPMMMTAAGTLKPCRAFVMGVGVAGLQACATAKRLGAVVEAYDIRPAAREQIISVGAKPVELDIEAENTETKGGYAAEQSDDFIQRQQQAMANVLAQQDVVITTAAIPGRKAPVLITKAMVDAMKPGTVIVDLAAETGGNCELTQAGEIVVHQGVTILGPKNIPGSAATHASQMYGTNVENLLKLLLDAEGKLQLDFADEIINDTVVTHQGELVNARLRELAGMPALNPAPVTEDSEKEAE
ncbi:NAD(P) transhydrogenase subunit alpha [Shewanella sp. NFH-SH190041]|uniref:Re/Si-specific NAD(P)(+) transhydrogenase subunit alpha n=1 Tax=Shewanella sp. NFH-SH190041 TaxID=2950245 RepID=UPI0021C2F99F|nr:Re/Si-specific NAD(P)(+) transhydrogenase subunit alpha [Shewanella sp. NFH-SH190041]BDM65559.1 NAD(P) transhydrogenase subunit alpha [Shewanella sp. NFH-SH190041]